MLSGGQKARINVARSVILNIKRHGTETWSALLALFYGNPLITGGFPLREPATDSFDVFIVVSPRKLLNKQSSCRWFEALQCMNRHHLFWPMFVAARRFCKHYSDVIISAMASQITGVSIVYSTLCSGADKRKHQSSASLAFEAGETPAQRASNAENVSIW